MATNAFVIRFPSGTYEYRTTRGGLPSLGQRFRIRGELWSVIQIHRNGVLSVAVERVDPQGEED